MQHHVSILNPNITTSNKALKEYIDFKIKQADFSELFKPLIVSFSNGIWESVTDVYLLSILLKLEYTQTKSITCAVNIRHFQMLKQHEIWEKLKQKDQSRWNLNRLPYAMKSKIENFKTYCECEQYCDLACAVLATTGYQHRMITLHESKYWCDKFMFDELYKRIEQIKCDKFDHRLFCEHDDKIFHTRCHAYDTLTNTSWHVVFSDDPEREISNLAAQFFVCGAKICKFINLTDGITWKLQTCNAHKLTQIIFEKLI